MKCCFNCYIIDIGNAGSNLIKGNKNSLETLLQRKYPFNDNLNVPVRNLGIQITKSQQNMIEQINNEFNKDEDDKYDEYLRKFESNIDADVSLFKIICQFLV